MFVVDDIFSLIRRGKNMASDIDDLRKYNTKSITKSVDDSTMMFGCLMSNTIPTDQAITFVRNMERVYASMVQQYLSQNQMIDVSIDRTPLDYLRRIHQNIRLESVIEEAAIEDASKKKDAYLSFMESTFPGLEVPEGLVDDVMEESYKGNYKLFMDRTGSYGVAFKESVCTPDLLNNYKSLIKEHLEDFDLRPFGYTVYTEANISRSDVVDAYMQGLENQVKTANADLALKKAKENKGTQLLDRDVKKSNDMQPYAIQVRLMAVNDKQEFIQYMDFIVGVKAVLHAIDSNEIVRNIAYILQNKNFTFNMIRWLTGEISLFKNMILNIDEVKFDVVNRSSGMSGWIPTLKRLKNKRVALGLFSAHKIIPNSTMVVTSYEVEQIKNATGLDLRDVSVAKRVIDKLFLIAFVIFDDGTNTIDILYDSRTEYQTYSMETLDREVSMNSNKLGKEIGRMISR